MKYSDVKIGQLVGYLKHFTQGAYAPNSKQYWQAVVIGKNPTTSAITLLALNDDTDFGATILEFPGSLIPLDMKYSFFKAVANTLDEYNIYKGEARTTAPDPTTFPVNLTYHGLHSYMSVPPNGYQWMATLEVIPSSLPFDDIYAPSAKIENGKVVYDMDRAGIFVNGKYVNVESIE